MILYLVSDSAAFCLRAGESRELGTSLPATLEGVHHRSTQHSSWLPLRRRCAGKSPSCEMKPLIVRCGREGFAPPQQVLRRLMVRRVASAWREEDVCRTELAPGVLGQRRGRISVCNRLNPSRDVLVQDCEADLDGCRFEALERRRDGVGDR